MSSIILAHFISFISCSLANILVLWGISRETNKLAPVRAFALLNESFFAEVVERLTSW